MKYYIISLISVLLMSCKSSHLSPKDSLVSISKNPCLKYCEVYDLHIYADGTFVYKGVLNVDKKGTHQGQISKVALSQIKELLEKMPQEYTPIKGRDIASITIKYKSANNTYKSTNIVLKDINSFAAEIVKSIP